MPDGHEWGAQEGLPKFFVLKVPGVAESRTQKYIDQVYEILPGATRPTIKRKSLWRARLADMPTRARNRITNDGELIIKVGTYAGTTDYTWTQVKEYFRNLETGLDETEEI